ncbi:MAG: SAF domain-containing protein [Sporichthyaceae bacterium]
MNNGVATSPGIPVQQVNGLAQAPSGRTALPTRGRRPGLIAVAVLLIVGFALSGTVLVSRAGDTTEVLIASRAVPAGHVIEAGDVAAVRLSGSVRAIAAGELRTVLGSTAAVGLVGGQVLNRDMLTTAAVPAEGQAMVGLALRSGQFPADGLSVGDRVLAVMLPAAGAAASTVEAAKALTVAQIYGLRPDDSGGTDTLVTLVVPLEFAGRILAHGSAGRLGLVKVAVTQ